MTSDFKFLEPRLRYHMLICNLMASVFEIDRRLIKIEGQFVVLSKRVIKKETMGGSTITTTEIEEDAFLHWIEAAVILLNEVHTKEEQVSEFSHCLLQSLLGDYDSDTLYPEQYLMKLYNLKLKEEEKKESGKETKSATKELAKKEDVETKTE